MEIKDKINVAQLFLLVTFVFSMSIQEYFKGFLVLFVFVLSLVAEHYYNQKYGKK